MKIKRSALKQLIETFIAGPRGGLADMESLKNTPDLFALLGPYQEKIINDPKTLELGFEKKFEMLFSTQNPIDKMSAFQLAKTLRILSNDDYNRVKKIINDIKLLKTAKSISKPEGGVPYKSVKGTSTDKLYSIRQAQRDDPNFEIRLAKRIKEIMGDPVVFTKKMFKNLNDLFASDHDIIEEVISEIVIELQHRYGNIYHKGVIDPAVKKILLDDLNLTNIVFGITGGLEEYAEYLDLTDLGFTIDSILEDVYDDVTVDSILQELKTRGYDETFFKESYEDMQGNLLFPQFDIREYDKIMKYYLIDRVRNSTDDVMIDGNIIYRNY